MKEKKTLLVTSTDVMCYLFLKEHIVYLNEFYNIHVVCSRPRGFVSNDYYNKLENYLPDDVELSQMSSQRSPFEIIKNVRGIFQLGIVLRSKKIDLIWTNEPVVGALTRLAAWFYRSKSTVIYMAHGLHFFKGAPLLNWILYPVEKFLSLITNAFILINKEDYDRVLRSFSKEAHLIPGLGFNVEYFSSVNNLTDSIDLRESLNLNVDSILLVSVGELMFHKNHQVILRALASIGDNNLHYIICGKGELQEELHNLAVTLEIESQVHMLGYREDIKSILGQSDIFCHPSKREGLGVASLEAMAVGLPIITSNIHGLKDYSVNYISGFNCPPNDINCFSRSIKLLIDDEKLRSKIAEGNRGRVKKYETKLISRQIFEIFNKMAI